jgi:hypothetical protein
LLIPVELIPLAAISIGGIAVIGRAIVQPVVHAVLKLAEQRQPPPADSRVLEQRMSELDERFNRLERAIDRVLADREFLLQLQSGKPDRTPPQP